MFQRQRDRDQHYRARSLKPTKGKTLSLIPVSSSMLLSLHLVTWPLAVFAPSSEMERLGNEVSLHGNSTKVVEKVLHNQLFYSLQKQATWKIE